MKEQVLNAMRAAGKPVSERRPQRGGQSLCRPQERRCYRFTRSLQMDRSMTIDQFRERMATGVPIVGGSDLHRKFHQTPVSLAINNKNSLLFRQRMHKKRIILP